MLVHHLLFWLKNPESEEDKKKLQQGLESLLPIETIRTSHIGVPASTDRPVIVNDYDFSLLVVFEDLEGHDIYQEHPLHKKFLEENAHLWAKVRIYDSVDA